MARPTKLNQAVQDRIVQAIRAGNYAEPAARAAGIAPSTFYRWLARGERERSGIHREFLEAIRLAEAEAEVHAVAVLRRAMSEDWRAGLAYLERRYPARWRRHTSTELTGPDGGPVRTQQVNAVDLTRLSDDELAQFERLYSRASEQD